MLAVSLTVPGTGLGVVNGQEAHTIEMEAERAVSSDGVLTLNEVLC